MNTLESKRHLANYLGSPYAGARDVILLYHSVAGGELSISEAKFREQMAWLKANAEVTTLHELVAPGLALCAAAGPGAGRLLNPRYWLGGDSRASTKKLLRVALTFDDGYATLAKTIQPILSEFGFPATAYVCTGMIGEGKRLSSRVELGHYPGEDFMNWDDVQSLSGHGWTIGGHGVDHVDLTAMSQGEAEAQLKVCKAKIEAKVGRPCAHFAYTWGRHNAQVRKLTANTGYACGAGGIHFPLRAKDDLFSLPRLDVRVEYEIADFVALAVGEWDFLGIKQRFL